MKRRMISIVVASLLAVAFAASAWGAPWQGWRGSGGWGMKGAYQRLYDPAKVETVSGEVAKVELMSARKGPGNGVHLLLRTGQETIPVHLGPAWFLERLDTRIEKGDRVEVKGARVTFDGKPAIIAAEVKKGDAVLQLRDQAGVPVWAGWRR
ncbi:DNA-binding protein [Geomonas sp. Red69]|uniref:DNA-binding protein n=1 Tax=Geomonas diazotrophica TaxID=2843197 RepID=A0ABX8JIA4_9BACT|nr:MULTISPECIES: DNA-binding protein [Geomonas]MBU5635225.1 DNA-binding protein [Geomonas diazotrophica]QWV97716.1 DNA-binding protein [Geomonas nitrogeniifigens]QXE86853.1 DNA-binding protein [Geomonas nitrogeniifigens]